MHLQEWLSLPYRYASPYLPLFSYLTSSEGCLGHGAGRDAGLEGPLGRRKTGSGGGRLAGGKSPAKSNSKNSPLERQGFYGKMELNSSLCSVVRLELMA